MIKAFLRGIFLTAFLLPPALSGAPPPLQSLNYKILEGGSVIVSDGSREVVKIQPRIFTGTNSQKWDGIFLFQDAELRARDGHYNGLTVVNGVRITLLYEINPIESGLHIIYHLVPTAPVTVSWVQVYSSFPYNDWKGTSYELDGSQGQVPENHFGTWLLLDSDSGFVSIGPSPAKAGLAFKMVSKGLHLRLVDDQYWGESLSVLYSHHDLETNWVWEKGESKDFDFTITFNRSLTSVQDFPTPLRVAALPTSTSQSFTQIRPRPTQVPVRRVLQPMPTLHLWRPTSIPTPFSTTIQQSVFSLPNPKPTPVPAWLPHLDLNNRVEFSSPPANIYVNFADGPGHYQVEVMDASGNSLESIFDEKVVRQGDKWLEWDGQDEKGKDAPPGQYFVIIYKNGKPLRSISVYRAVTR